MFKPTMTCLLTVACLNLLGCSKEPAAPEPGTTSTQQSIQQAGQNIQEQVGATATQLSDSAQAMAASAEDNLKQAGEAVQEKVEYSQQEINNILNQAKEKYGVKQ